MSIDAVYALWDVITIVNEPAPPAPGDVKR
jgi:hypothetical protein